MMHQLKQLQNQYQQSQTQQIESQGPFSQPRQIINELINVVMYLQSQLEAKDNQIKYLNLMQFKQEMQTIATKNANAAIPLEPYSINECLANLSSKQKINYQFELVLTNIIPKYLYKERNFQYLYAFLHYLKPNNLYDSKIFNTD